LLYIEGKDPSWLWLSDLVGISERETIPALKRGLLGALGRDKICGTFLRGIVRSIIYIEEYSQKIF
jgi:hypothetical protein